MMTTMAALVGTLPIALGIGAGAESRRPLGLAVVGGLLVSQLLTLYITPVYYMLHRGRAVCGWPNRQRAPARPRDVMSTARRSTRQSLCRTSSEARRARSRQ